jgi:hypothetical protein
MRRVLPLWLLLGRSHVYERRRALFAPKSRFSRRYACQLRRKWDRLSCARGRRAPRAKWSVIRCPQARPSERPRRSHHHNRYFRKRQDISSLFRFAGPPTTGRAAEDSKSPLRLDSARSERALDQRQNIAASSTSRRCAASRAAVTWPAAPAVGPMATKRTVWTPMNRRMSRR